MSGTYKEHLGPFDRIDGIKAEVENATSSLLKKHGWEITCQTPGAYWMWQKTLPDGRTVLLNTEAALRWAHDAAADLVAPEEFAD